MEGIAPPFLRLAIGGNIPAILGKRTGVALKKIALCDMADERKNIRRIEELYCGKVKHSMKEMLANKKYEGV
jgi:hypothetical protein